MKAEFRKKRANRHKNKQECRLNLIFSTLLIIKQLSSPLFWNYSFLYKICCKTQNKLYLCNVKHKEGKPLRRGLIGKKFNLKMTKEMKKIVLSVIVALKMCIRDSYNMERSIPSVGNGTSQFFGCPFHQINGGNRFFGNRVLVQLFQLGARNNFHDNLFCLNVQR